MSNLEEARVSRCGSRPLRTAKSNGKTDLEIDFYNCDIEIFIQNSKRGWRPEGICIQGTLFLQLLTLLKKPL